MASASCSVWSMASLRSALPQISTTKVSYGKSPAALFQFPTTCSQVSGRRGLTLSRSFSGLAFANPLQIKQGDALSLDNCFLFISFSAFSIELFLYSVARVFVRVSMGGRARGINLSVDAATFLFHTLQQPASSPECPKGFPSPTTQFVPKQNLRLKRAELVGKLSRNVSFFCLPRLEPAFVHTLHLFSLILHRILEPEVGSMYIFLYNIK